MERAAMAKMWKVPELNCSEDFATLARRRSLAAQEDTVAAGALKAALDDSPPSPYSLGVLGLLARMREQRERAFLDVRELWRRLESEGLRTRLERLVVAGEASGGAA